MNFENWGRITSVSALAVALAACGSGANDEPAPEVAEVILPSGMTVAEQIEARQEKYEALGDTFRTLNQQFRSGNPDLAVVQEAAAQVPTIVEGMETWFPTGTGPESGIETEALSTIWETPDDFAQKITEHQAAAAALAKAAEGDDLQAIQAALQATGATCGACHDDYRLDD